MAKKRKSQKVKEQHDSPETTTGTKITNGAKHLEGEPAPPAFGTKDYWDKEFGEGIYKDAFDWVCEWSDVEGDLAKLLNKSDKILVPGCGNAPFQLQMHDAGYKQLVCGDNSEVVIEQNQDANMETRPSIEWDLMDCTAMDYEDNSFDAVVDKSLLDCLHCCDGANEITRAYLNEVHRVLKPGGKFIRLSFHKSHTMKAYMRGWDWTIDTQMIEVKTQDDGANSSEAATVEGEAQVDVDTCWKLVKPVDGGVAYYVNSATGETSFDPPITPVEEEPSASGGAMEGLSANEACLCVCVKSRDAYEEDLTMAAKSKKDKKKAAKNQRRLTKMLEGESREEGLIE